MKLEGEGLPAIEVLDRVRGVGPEQSSHGPSLGDSGRDHHRDGADEDGEKLDHRRGILLPLPDVDHLDDAG